MNALVTAIAFPVAVLLSAMKPDVTAVERAFQLARTGRCASVGRSKLQLKDEGYSSDQIEGRVLQRQLAQIVRDATKP